MLSHGSQVLFDPTYIVELFVLGHPVEEGAVEEAGPEEPRSREGAR